MGEILQMIASSDSFDEDNFATFLDHAKEISSNYDLSKVLNILTQIDNLSNQNQIELINAIGEVSSNYERSKLLMAFAPNLSDNNDVRESFLIEAKTLSDSDFGKIMRSLNY